MHKQLKRIEDYNKTLPVLEVYTAVQSEGSRQGYPTIVVRTTGCTHRCYFGEGGWCDSWYTSIHPEKGTYSFQDIIDAYDQHPHIKEMMLTGGSPTMHPKLVNELTHFAHERNWVWDFGGMKRAKTLIDGKQPKAWMDYMFDHTLIVAEDDPNLKAFQQMDKAGVAQVRVIPATGAEKFAEYIYRNINEFVKTETNNRVRVTKVKFMEHGKNAAYYSE